MLHRNGIQAVLFDLDGTLLFSLPSPNETLYDNAVKLGVPDSPERRRRAMRWIHSYWAQSAEMLEDIDRLGRANQEFWTNFTCRALVAYDLPQEQAQELAPQVRELMSGQEWTVCLPPEVPATLQALQVHGFHLGVVSNRTDPFRDQLVEWGLQGYFGCSLAAGEVNSWKPEVVIFQHALQLLGTRPDQTIYVGDNYYADVVGARAAGLLPVLVDPAGIFPDADCPVIPTVSDIIPLLENIR